MTGRYRRPSLPDLPSVELSGWLGNGPSGLPEDIRQEPRKAVVEIVKQPAMQQRFCAIGFEPAGQDANTFAAYHVTEVARWKNFASEIGMSK